VSKPKPDFLNLNQKKSRLDLLRRD